MRLSILWLKSLGEVKENLVPLATVAKPEKILHSKTYNKTRTYTQYSKFHCIKMTWYSHLLLLVSYEAQYFVAKVFGWG